MAIVSAVCQPILEALAVRLTQEGAVSATDAFSWANVIGATALRKLRRDSRILLRASKGRAGVGGTDVAELDVREGDGGVGDGVLNIRRGTGGGRTGAPLDAGLAGVTVRGIAAVQPEHVGCVVIPDTEDEHHAVCRGLAHVSHPSLLVETVAVAEGSLLRIAEGGGDGVVRSHSGDVGL